ncbi:MAG TPA: hypothetical protein VID29_09290 [Solirubrobacteraceae bacterium]
MVFDEASFDEDMKRAGTSAAKIGRLARRRFEAEGIGLGQLRSCGEEGDDGTSLPWCVKVYLPQPAGRFGMVLQLVAHSKGVRLRCLAFGVRHHPRGSHAPTVYELAHKRLHG